MIPPLQMNDNWQKSFLNVLSNTMSCAQKENGNAMDMLEDEKKTDGWYAGGGRARNPKIQCKLHSVLSQDVGFQIMKIKKLTVEQKKRMRKRERQPL